MWESVCIRHFRGFEELELTGLGPVNLVGGPNNVGKTNLLEALFLHSGAGNAELALRLNLLRGLILGVQVQQPEPGRLASDLLGTLFYRGRTDRPFEITTTDHLGAKATTRFRLAAQPAVSVTAQTPIPMPAPQVFVTVELGELEYISSEKANVPNVHKLVALVEVTTGRLTVQAEGPATPAPRTAVFLPLHLKVPVEDAQRLANLIREGQDRKVTEALKVIEPRLEGLLPLPMLGVPTIFARLGEGAVLPLGVAGEGLERLARLLLAVGAARGGVVLVDEIEAGFHYSVLKNVWKVVAEATADYQVQLFATTHDWEAIVAAHEAFSELEEYERFRYVRLDREDGRVRPRVYSREALQAAIEAGLEVR